MPDFIAAILLATHRAQTVVRVSCRNAPSGGIDVDSAHSAGMIGAERGVILHAVKTGGRASTWSELVRSRDRVTAAGHRGVSSFGHGDGGFPGHPANACRPMLTGPAGIVISLKDVHW